MADVKGKMPFFVSKTNPVTITGLTPDTSYDFQLVVYDNNENSTVWEDPITFKTLPANPILNNFQLQLIKPISEFAKGTFKVTTTDSIQKAILNLDINNNKIYDFTLNSKIESISYDKQTYPYYCLVYIADTNISTSNRYKLCISQHELKFIQYQSESNYNVKLTYDDSEMFYVIESDTIDGLLTQIPTTQLSSLDVYLNHETSYLLSQNQYKFDYFSSNYDTDFFVNSSDVSTRTYYNYCSIDENGDGTIYIYNLLPETAYEITLTVYDSYNQFAKAGPVTIVTKNIPPLITNIIEQSIKQHEITFYIECETNVGIKTYTYSYGIESVTTPSNPYTIANLQTFTDYTFNITVTDINGQTDSMSKTVKTSGTGPQISDLSITNITTSTATATVTATSQDAIDKYVWSCNNKVSQTDVNTIEIEDLNSYTNYTLNVVVYDINENYDTRSVDFTTQSNGIDILTCDINNIGYTSFDVLLTTEQNIPIKNIEVKLTNVNNEEDIQTFSGFDDLNFTIENVYPNKTYSMKITITDIDNVSTVYNYPTNIVMKTANINLSSIDISDITHNSFVAQVNYTSDIQVNSINLKVYNQDEQPSYNMTQDYTDNIFNVDNLIQNTNYNVTATLIFNNFQDININKTVTISTLSNPVYIYFDTDGGTEIETLQKYQNDIINLNDYIPTKTGYNFNGWYIGDTKYEGNYTVGNTDVTFVAQWQIQTFTVTFEYYGDGATYDNKNIQTTTQQVNYGDSALAPTLPENPLTYNFQSWDNDFSSITSELTVTAQYTGVEYYISFQSDFGNIDGLNDDGVLVYNYGEPINVLPTISGISQDFEGWSTEQGNPDNIITTSTIWTFTDVDILYAIFEMYKLTYNYGDGVGYNTISLLNANGFSYYNTTENSGTIEVIDNNTIVLNAVSGTKHTLRSIMQISSTNNGMIAYANVDNNADINIQIINNTDNPTYNLETLIPNEISQNIYIDLVIYVPSSPGTYNIRNIDIKGLYEQSPEYQYKTVGEQVGTLPTTWSNNKGIIGKWYNDTQGTTEILSTTVFNEDTTIYAIYKPKELKSILLDGNSFNSIYRSTAPNASALYFTNTKIPNDKMSNAKIVSTSNSPYVSYLYMDGNNAYVSPEEDNIPIYANEDCSDIFEYCVNIASLDLSNFNTSNVTGMNNMFNECNALTSIIGLENFNTSKVDDMMSMFSSCGSLTTLDLSGWDTSNVSSMEDMFNNCNKLSGSITIMNPNIKMYSNMFTNCSTAEDTQFLVNYINDTTKNIATQMVATKSDNSHVYLYGSQQAFAVYSAADSSLKFYKRYDMPNPNVGLPPYYYDGNVIDDLYTGIETNNIVYHSLSRSRTDESAQNIERAPAIHGDSPFSPSYIEGQGFRIIEVMDEGIQPINMDYWFDSFDISRLELSLLDTSKVTSMIGTFKNTISLEGSVNGLDMWDLSSLTNTTNMFSNFRDLNSSMTINSNKVTLYSLMFYDSCTNDNARFILKYTDDATKALAEQMVATKSSNSNVYLYSQTTISFDSTGGNDISSTITATIGEPIQNLPIPVRGGYSFDGWENPNDSSIITNGSIWKYGDSNITLQATWSVSTGYIIGNPSTTGASQNPISVGLNFDGMGSVKTDFPAIQNNNGVYTGTSISEEEGIKLYEPALKFEGLAWNGITLRFYNSSTAPILVGMYYERTSPMGNVLTSYAITINPGQQEEIMSMMSAGGFNLYILLQNTSGTNYELKNIAIEVI